VEVTDEATVEQANSINAQTTGVVTATISDTSLAVLADLTGTGNAYTITVNDLSANAAALNSLDGKTTVNIDATAVETISGNAEDIVQAINTTTIAKNDYFGLLVSGNSITTANLITLDNLTTGAVDVSNINSINGSLVSLVSVYQSGGITGRNNIAITVTDTTVSANSLNTLIGLTTSSIDLSAATTITGTLTNVDTAYGLSRIIGLGNESVTLQNTSTALASVLNTLNTRTSGQIDATVVTTITGTSAEISTVFSVPGITTSSGVRVNMSGDESANLLIGYAGNDTISGLGGGDTLRGGAGNDSLDGGTGTDTADFSDKTTAVVLTLNGATNATATIGGVELDTIINIENISGGSAADNLTGDTLANLLIGNGGNDTLTGNGGNDTLTGGDGNDSLNGGNGTDTANFSDKTTAVVLTLNGATNATATIGSIEQDTIINIENITGGSAADTLTGDGLANTFRGGDGNDTLDGGAGSDTADFSDKTTAVVLTLNGATNSTATIGGVAEDTIVNIENITGGSAADNFTGDNLANNLLGNGGNDTLLGADGNDTFRGGDGNDFFDGGTGSDYADFADKTTSVVLTLNGATNTTVTVGGVAEDTIVNIENVTGGTAADILTGDGLVNFLLGNSGNDTLLGLGGNDFLRGSGGNDSLDGGTGLDTVDFSDRTGAVVLTLNGATNATATIGGVELDTIVNIENITGGSAADTLTGDTLANSLVGNGGNDTLSGLGGNDTLTGSDGTDTFLFSTAPNTSTNRDTITDFISATDKLSFSRTAYGGFGTQTALTAAQFASGANLAAASNANQRFIYDTNSGILRFDSDGSGATASIEVAVLSSKPTIVFGDFSLFA
jgi:Ca2+-binding RTX toxin-like protein